MLSLADRPPLVLPSAPFVLAAAGMVRKLWGANVLCEEKKMSEQNRVATLMRSCEIENEAGFGRLWEEEEDCNRRIWADKVSLGFFFFARSCSCEGRLNAAWSNDQWQEGELWRACIFSGRGSRGSRWISALLVAFNKNG